MNGLTRTEVQELQELETTIEQGLRDFLQVGSALLTIREKRLYRDTHKNFDTYCRDKWEITGARAYQLIRASDVASELSEDSEVSQICDTNYPSSHLPQPKESQAMALAEAPKGERAAAWKEAVETAPKDKAGNPKPTAKHVEKVVAKRQEKPAVPAELPTDEVGALIEDEKIQRAFEQRPAFKSFMRTVSELKKDFAELAEAEGGVWAAQLQKKFNTDVDNLYRYVRFSVPYSVCLLCGGRKCEACSQSGYLNEERHDRIKARLDREGRGA